MYTAKGEKPLVALPSIRQHILQYSPSWQAVRTGVIMVVLLKDNQPFGFKACLIVQNFMQVDIKIP